MFYRRISTFGRNILPPSSGLNYRVSVIVRFNQNLYRQILVEVSNIEFYDALSVSLRFLSCAQIDRRTDAWLSPEICTNLKMHTLALSRVFCHKKVRDSSVGIATSLRAGQPRGRGSIPGKGSFPWGVKRQGREADHLPPSDKVSEHIRIILFYFIF
jgi:hypothetical protein